MIGGRKFSPPPALFAPLASLIHPLVADKVRDHPSSPPASLLCPGFAWFNGTKPPGTPSTSVLPAFCANRVAEPKLGERRLVVPAGNVPASSGYQSGALLLSYETASSCGFAPNCRTGRKTMFGFVPTRMRMTRLGL